MNKDEKNTRANGVMIGALPDGGTAELTDQFEIQRGNESKKLTLNQIKDVVGGGGGSTTPNPFSGLDNTGNVDVTADFQKVLNDNQGKDLFLPAGTYKVGSLTIPSNTRLASISAILKQSAPANMLNIGSNTDNVLIQGLTLIGTNLTEKPSTEISSKAIFVNGSLSVSLKDLIIRGFGTGVEWTQTGYNKSQKYSYSGNLTNISVFQCYYGYRSNTRGEFFNVVGCRASLCRFGAWIGGGNNMISNCQFNNNGNGAYLIGNNMDNHGHGSFTGCQFNHNSGGKSIWFNGVDIGYMVSGCQFFDGQVLLEGNTKGVIFSACEGGTWTINDNTTAGYDNLMMCCFFYTAPGGNWKNKLKNQYNLGPGSVFEPPFKLTENELIDVRFDKKFGRKITGNILSAGSGFVHYVDMANVVAANDYVYGILARVTNYSASTAVNAEGYLINSLNNQILEVVPYTQVYQSEGVTYLLFKVAKSMAQNTILGVSVERDGGASSFGLAYSEESNIPAYNFGSGKLTVGQTISATPGRINCEVGYLTRF